MQDSESGNSLVAVAEFMLSETGNRYLDVFLPKLLPASILSPNRGERREGRVPLDISDAKRTMRAETYLALIAHETVRAWREPAEYALLAVTLRRLDRGPVARLKAAGVPTGNVYRPDDPGNAVYSLKAAIDGMVDAGLIIDDSLLHLGGLLGRVERVESLEDEGLRVQLLELGRPAWLSAVGASIGSGTRQGSRLPLPRSRTSGSRSASIGVAKSR